MPTNLAPFQEIIQTLLAAIIATEKVFKENDALLAEADAFDSSDYPAELVEQLKLADDMANGLTICTPFSHMPLEGVMLALAKYDQPEAVYSVDSYRRGLAPVTALQIAFWQWKVLEVELPAETAQEIEDYLSTELNAKDMTEVFDFLKNDYEAGLVENPQLHAFWKQYLAEHS